MNQPYDTRLPSYSLALDALRIELEQIPESRLETIRLDPAEAIPLALGVSANVKRFEAEVVRLFGETAGRHIGRLELTARAFGRAHANHVIALHGKDVADMADDLARLRRVLLVEAQSLVAQKRLSSAVLAELAGGNGYKAMCLDVVQLVAAFRADWAGLESATPVTSPELDHAEALSNALFTTIGENEHAVSSSPTAAMRQRAYTLFVRTYDEVRRLVTYLRWDEDDADEIAPSLFSRRKSHDGDDEVEPVVTPALNGGAPVHPGMPGGSPFATP